LHVCNIIDYKTGSGGKRNIEAFSYNHYCSGKAINISYSESFVCSLRNTAFNAPALYCHLCSALLYCIFHIISYTVRFSGGWGEIEPKMRVLIFSTTFFPETFRILRVSQSVPIIHVHRSLCEVPVILCWIQRSWPSGGKDVVGCFVWSKRTHMSITAVYYKNAKLVLGQARNRRRV